MTKRLMTGRSCVNIPLRVEWWDEGEVRRVEAAGEIDLASVSELDDALDTDLSRVVVDLTGVTFIDLSGLRSLLRAADKHEAVRVRPSRCVMRLMGLAAVEHRFEVDPPPSSDR